MTAVKKLFTFLLKQKKNKIVKKITKIRRVITEAIRFYHPSNMSKGRNKITGNPFGYCAGSYGIYGW